MMTAPASPPALNGLLAAPIGPPPPAPGIPEPPPPGAPPPQQPVVDPPATDPPQVEPGLPPPVSDPPPGAQLVEPAPPPGAQAIQPKPAPHAGAAAPTEAPLLSRLHARRLREIHRSAGWPAGDAIEIDLLAAGLLQRLRSDQGHESLRLSDAGIAQLAGALVMNRAALTRHEALVEQVAREMTRAGRIAWRGLSLRARLPPLEVPEGGAASAAAAAAGPSAAVDDGGRQSALGIDMPGIGPVSKPRWCVARPDLFSIRNTSVEAYAQPIVHEIKVSRADLLGDLRKPDKRAAYLDLGGECWYVLGCDGRGQPIAEPEEIPPECGVLIAREQRLVVARPAPHRATPRIPFAVWMALAKAQPVAGVDDELQSLLGELQE